MKKVEPKSAEVLSPKQLADEFGISISKQNKLRMRKSKENDGEYALPFFRVGKRVLYRRESIKEWFLKCENREMGV